MEGNICLYLMKYLILRIHINVKNCRQKNKCFGIYFSIVHISLNFSLRNMKSCVAVGDIHMEGTVIYVLIFVLCQKNGQLFKILNQIVFFLLNFIKTKKRTRRYIRNLRHSSLCSNIVNTYVKFEIYVVYSNIYVQNTKD